MRGRVPSAVVATLAVTGVLIGSGLTAYAVVRRHPADASTQSVVAANQIPAVQTITSAAAVTQVAPLRHLVQPNLLVSEPGTLSAKTVNRLRQAAHARSAVTFDLGRVKVNGETAWAVAANLSDFRAFTPPPTAASDLLWQNLARGDIAVSYAFARAHRLQVGQDVTLGSQIVRLGAIAEFGMPQISVVMSPAMGAGYALRPRAGVLLSAPGRSGSALTSGARDVVGRAAHIVAMNVASPSSYSGKPRTYIELYRAAARTCPGLSWTILAAIGQVESDHGRNVGPSSAGALGPMQFMPATWASWGVDADGDKKADIMDPYDAVYAAARYLCYYSPGSGLAQLKRAIFAYNHADWYVNEVLALAKLYG